MCRELKGDAAAAATETQRYKADSLGTALPRLSAVKQNRNTHIARGIPKPSSTSFHVSDTQCASECMQQQTPKSQRLAAQEPPLRSHSATFFLNNLPQLNYMNNLHF